MAGGRPAKPTALKLLHGDDKKNPGRVNRSEPVPAAVEIAAPSFLSPEAREIWDEIAPDRIRKGVLTAWDVQAFAAFCEGLRILRYAPEHALDLAKPGQESPMAKFRQAVSICSALGGRFGWTPADRQKLIVGEGKRDDDADLLSG